MKHFLRPTLTAAAMAVALGMTAGVYAQAAKTGTASSTAGTIDKAKASQLLGFQMVGQIPGPMRGLVDPVAVGQAVTAALSGQKPTMSETEANTVWKGFMTEYQTKAKAEYEAMAAKNKQEGDAFLAKNKKVAGVKTTASGLQYQVISQGTGARPGPTDTVEINYTGSLIDGEVFDASAKHPPGGTAKIPLGGVLPGFREGLQLMQVGGHYKLFIPASLAYGAEPQQQMAPNETLIFDVTLVSTAPTPAGAGGPDGK